MKRRLLVASGVLLVIIVGIVAFFFFNQMKIEEDALLSDARLVFGEARLQQASRPSVSSSGQTLLANMISENTSESGAAPSSSQNGGTPLLPSSSPTPLPTQTIVAVSPTPTPVPVSSFKAQLSQEISQVKSTGAPTDSGITQSEKSLWEKIWKLRDSAPVETSQFSLRFNQRSRVFEVALKKGFSQGDFYGWQKEHQYEAIPSDHFVFIFEG